MNSTQSSNHPFPQPDDVPLRLREAAMASVIVIAACASIAIAFTTIATCQAANGVIKRIFRRGGRHAP